MSRSDLTRLSLALLFHKDFGFVFLRPADCPSVWVFHPRNKDLTQLLGYGGTQGGKKTRPDGLLSSFSSTQGVTQKRSREPVGHFTCDRAFVDRKLKCHTWRTFPQLYRHKWRRDFIDFVCVCFGPFRTGSAWNNRSRTLPLFYEVASTWVHEDDE